MLYKKYINVLTMIDKQGRMVPKAISWDNGAEYVIDRVLEVRNAASVVGGGGVLYRCRILGEERNLFFERTRWFIESERP